MKAMATVSRAAVTGKGILFLKPFGTSHLNENIKFILVSKHHNPTATSEVPLEIFQHPFLRHTEGTETQKDINKKLIN